MRKTVVAVLVLVAALAVWLGLRSPAPAPAPPADAGDAPRVERPMAPTTPRESVPGDAPVEPGSAAGARQARVDPEQEPERDPVVIQVEEFDTGNAIAGAHVTFLDLEWLASREASAALERSNDSVDVAFAHGPALLSDAEGRVRLQRCDRPLTVFGRSGERVGQAPLWPASVDSSGMTRLRLQRPATFTVRVEDAAGSPCATVEALLVRDDECGRSAFGYVWTGLDGTARFENAFAPLDDVNARIGATVALPFKDPPYAALDPKRPPTAPILLRLRPTGSVRCQVVDESLARAGDGLYVHLRVPRTERERFEAEVRRDEADAVGGGTSAFDEPFDDAIAVVRDGVARFPYVGLGLELEVEIPSPGEKHSSVKQPLRGPTVRGDEVVVQIVLGPPRPVVVGRLVDGAGAPVAGIELVAEVAEPGDARVDLTFASLRSTTADDGSFRFVLDRAAGPSLGARLHVGREVERAHFRGAREVAVLGLPDTLPAGDTKIGDVVLRGTETLAAGVVVGPGGEPLSCVLVQAMEERERRDRCPDPAVAAVRTDAQGRFRLEGERSEEHVLIGAELEGWFVPDAPRVAAGTEHVRIEMRRAGGIAGSVELPQGMDCLGIQVRILGAAQENGDAGHRHDDEMQVDLERDGRFEVHALRPGKARVLVRDGDDDKDLVLAVDVLVREGEVTRDPRLQNVDPAGGRARFRLTVVDGDGRTCAGATIHSRARGEPWTEATTGIDGSILVAPRRLPVEVLAIDDAGRCARNADVRGETTLVLEPATTTTIRVRLADGVPLPDPPYSLHAGLDWIGDGTDVRSGGSHPFDVHDRPFDVDRTITIQTHHPGRYRMALWLWNRAGSGGGGFPTLPDPLIVTLPAGGEVEVPVEVDLSLLRERTR